MGMWDVQGEWGALSGEWTSSQTQQPGRTGALEHQLPGPAEVLVRDGSAEPADMAAKSDS